MDSESPTSAPADETDDSAGGDAPRQECGRVAELLVDAERRLADVPELNLRIADLEFELAAARLETAAARREAWELDQMLMYGRRLLRYVRPMIGPLRDARKRLRS